MGFYSIGKVAKISKVSKRTLHHYHDLGLLVPDGKSNSGYRLYSSQNLLTLQQILLYRQCGIPLSDIKLLISDSKERHIALLINQQDRLRQQIVMSRSQLKTLEKTIERLKGNEMAITDNELYEGFGNKAVTIRQEAIDKWGDEVEKVENKLKLMNKKDWSASKTEGEAIAKELSLLVHLSSDDESVQSLVSRQLNWLNTFYPVSKEKFQGLANMYVDDPKFKRFYDKHAEGTAELLRGAMLHFALTNKWESGL